MERGRPCSTPTPGACMSVDGHTRTWGEQGPGAEALSWQQAASTVLAVDKLWPLGQQLGLKHTPSGVDALFAPPPSTVSSKALSRWLVCDHRQSSSTRHRIHQPPTASRRAGDQKTMKPKVEPSNSACTSPIIQRRPSDMMVLNACTETKKYLAKIFARVSLRACRNTCGG